MQMCGMHRPLQELVNELVKEKMSLRERTKCLEALTNYQPKEGDSFEDMKRGLLKLIKTRQNRGDPNTLAPAMMLRIIVKYLPGFTIHQLHQLGEEILDEEDNAKMVTTVFDFIISCSLFSNKEWNYRGNRRTEEPRRAAPTYGGRQTANVGQVKKGGYTPQCFNCDGPHYLTKCPKPRDEKRIKATVQAVREKRQAREKNLGWQKKSGSRSYGQKMVKELKEMDSDEDDIYNAVAKSSKSDESYPSVCAILNIDKGRQSRNQNYIKVTVNEQKIVALLDTGSDINVMSEIIAAQLDLDVKLKPKRFKTAGQGNDITSSGAAIAEIQLRKDQTDKVRILVMIFKDKIVGAETCILGTTFMSQLDSMDVVSRIIKYKGKKCRFGNEMTKESEKVYKSMKEEKKVFKVMLEELEFPDRYDDTALERDIKEKRSCVSNQWQTTS
jgi:mRNA-degrading endonuclease YafQ of YafQ-DinJ toxin-antitoxin module